MGINYLRLSDVIKDPLSAPLYNSDVVPYRDYDIVWTRVVKDKGVEVRCGNNHIQWNDGPVTRSDMPLVRKNIFLQMPEKANEYAALTNPSRQIYLQSGTFIKALENTTGIQNIGQYGISPDVLANVQEIQLKTSTSVNEFARYSGYFSSLQILDIAISPFDIYPPKTEILVVPESVEDLRIRSSLVEVLDLQYSHLSTLCLVDNNALQYVNGMHIQSNLENMVLTNARRAGLLDLEEVLSHNPDCEVSIDVQDLCSARIPEGMRDKIKVIECCSGDLAEYSTESQKEIIKQLSDKVNEYMEKLEKKTDLEKALYVFREITQNVEYPDKQDKDMLECHSMINSLLKSTAVCESQAKALAYVLNKIGVQAEIVPCLYGEIKENEDMAGEYFSPKILQKIKFENERYLNHMIARVKIDGSWLYCDPTSDIFPGVRKILPQIGLVSKQELMDLRTGAKKNEVYVLPESERSVYSEKIEIDYVPIYKKLDQEKESNRIAAVTQKFKDLFHHKTEIPDKYAMFDTTLPIRSGLQARLNPDNIHSVYGAQYARISEQISSVQINNREETSDQDIRNTDREKTEERSQQDYDEYER